METIRTVTIVAVATVLFTTPGLAAAGPSSDLAWLVEGLRDVGLDDQADAVERTADHPSVTFGADIEVPSHGSLEVVVDWRDGTLSAEPADPAALPEARLDPDTRRAGCLFEQPSGLENPVWASEPVGMRLGQGTPLAEDGCGEIAHFRWAVHRTTLACNLAGATADQRRCFIVGSHFGNFSPGLMVVVCSGVTPAVTAHDWTAGDDTSTANCEALLFGIHPTEWTGWSSWCGGEATHGLALCVHEGPE